MNKEVEANTTLSHYRILTKIGEGGMGEVYLAEDITLNRKVALKILPENISSDDERLRRFEQEAFAASALNHPNILTIYEIGSQDNLRFIASEFVKGETLRERMKHQPLTELEALDIAIQITSALQSAHEARIVHRDIKPENIMLREDEFVKVLDFGLAKLIAEKKETIDSEAATRAQVNTTPGIVMGTVAYMSPEQARGLKVDTRTDIWSFGAVLFEMLTCKQPFTGDTISDTIAAILRGEPESLEENAPAEMRRIVKKCLQKKADERYQTAKDLLIDLRQLKKQLEIGAEIERTASPNKSEAKTQIINATTTDTAPTVSGVKYLTGEIRQHKRGFAIILITLLLATIGLGYWFFADRSLNTKKIESIAVMPSVNESGNADVEYLSDGMTESLINSLSQLPNMKVIARSSAFRYKGKDKDLSQIARELNVQAIIDGRVVQRGAVLSISVELIDTQNNTQLWGKQFTRKSSDIFVLQADITKQITDSLRVRLTGEQQERLTKRYTDNEEAYKLYLQGRYFWNRRSVEDFKIAIPYFQKAIEIDPNFALAYSGLSDSYILLGMYPGGEPPKDTMPLAKEAALKALSLDENLAEAHASLGQYLINYEYDWAGAERELKRSIELNPNYASAYQWYAEQLSWAGRFEEAETQAHRAAELDPLSRIINNVLARVPLFARRYDEAITIFRKNIELNPNWLGDYEYIFDAYAAKGMFAEAVDAHIKFMTSAKLAPPSEIQATQESFARSGWQGFLRHRVKYLEESSQREYVNPVYLAELYAYLGEKDKAFASLEKGYQMRINVLVELKHKSSFNNLRDDPRFEELLRKVGFPQ